MTVFQMQCFLEAVRQGSFALAAEALYISQPTMSRQIRSLEEELQVPLFLRDHNTIKVTAIGQELYGEIQQLYDTVETFNTRIREVVNRRLGRLRIGVLDSINVNDAMREAILMVKKKYPKALLQICHLTLRDSYAALRDGRLDVLFMLNTSMTEGNGIRSLQLYRDRMCVAVPYDHPNANLPCISNEEIQLYFGDMHYALLAAEEFEPPLRPNKVSTVAGYSEDYVNKISGPFAELDSLMMMVHAGLGITCVNETGVLQHNPKVRLIPLVDKTAEGIREHEVYINPYWMDYNENDMLRYFIECLAATCDPEPDKNGAEAE